MFRIIVSALVGAATTMLIAATIVVPTIRESWRAQGHNEGSIQARTEIAVMLRPAFAGAPSKCERQQTLFSVKATTVHIVNCGGIKTLWVEE